MMIRQTKIVATLGPASDSLIESLVAGGVDVFRLNFSHGSHDEHGERVASIRAAAARLGRFVAILADLQGPKLRIRGFAETSAIDLEVGQEFAIDVSLGQRQGDRFQVGTTHDHLPAELTPGDVLILGDGLIELEVTACRDQRVLCRVLMGGRLDTNKGINKRGGGLSAPALTKKDLADLTFACAAGVDYIGVSFPRCAADIEQARQLIADEYCTCGVVAKLERTEAVADAATLDAIILAADAVMVARGDLGIEIGDAALMGMQKRIINRARELNRSVITATQMMESMINNPRPTRAEVMDVANAVVDGTDAVMLSAETAVGSYPMETVNSMVAVIEGAEASTEYGGGMMMSHECASTDESIAIAAMTVADRLVGVRAVACFTSSGNTPKLMSRRRSRLPIYALSDNPQTLAKVALYRGVHPILFDAEEGDYAAVNETAVDWLKQARIINAGDRVILSKGDRRNVPGGTNTLKVVEAE